jgi:hypothetical protein
MQQNNPTDMLNNCIVIYFIWIRTHGKKSSRMSLERAVINLHAKKEPFNPIVTKISKKPQCSTNNLVRLKFQSSKIQHTGVYNLTEAK